MLDENGIDDIETWLHEITGLHAGIARCAADGSLFRREHRGAPVARRTLRGLCRVRAFRWRARGLGFYDSRTNRRLRLDNLFRLFGLFGLFGLSGRLKVCGRGCLRGRRRRRLSS